MRVRNMPEQQRKKVMALLNEGGERDARTDDEKEREIKGGMKKMKDKCEEDGKVLEMIKRYRVQGIDEFGRLFSEVVEARSRTEAEEKIMEEGLWGRKVKDIHAIEEATDEDWEGWD